MVVPTDLEAFGYWLKAAFGAPTTTGTRPNIHTFQSGNWTLPSMAIEVAMPEVPRFAMCAGCVMDQLSWQMNRSGMLIATARLFAQGEAIATTTAAGTPTALGLQRFGHFNGVVQRNGTALGNVVSTEITYSDGLDRIEIIRNNGKVEGADPGMAALTGRIEVRFANSALVRRLETGLAVPHWLLLHGPTRKALGLILVAAAILLFLFNLRRAGERAGSAAERLDARERNDAIHRQMLDAAARRPPPS